MTKVLEYVAVQLGTRLTLFQNPFEVAAGQSRRVAVRAAFGTINERLQ